jgi:hypothetical protein
LIDEGYIIEYASSALFLGVQPSEQPARDPEAKPKSKQKRPPREVSPGPVGEETVEPPESVATPVEAEEPVATEIETESVAPESEDLVEVPAAVMEPELEAAAEVEETAPATPAS